MPMLARMVLTMADRLGAGPADAYATGDAEGGTRAHPYAAAPSSLEALVSDLDRLGFDPVVTDGEADTTIVAFANCPFGELAAVHPDIVCSLHHGMIAGFVRTMGGEAISEFCNRVARTPCRVALTPR
jgi:predicted ArsR family transcriptional regulator